MEAHTDQTIWNNISVLHEYHIQVGYYASYSSTDHHLVYSVWVGVCLAELCGNVTVWWEMTVYCPNSFTLVHSRVCFHRDFCNSSSFTMSAYSVSAHSLQRIADNMNLEIILYSYTTNTSALLHVHRWKFLYTYWLKSHYGNQGNQDDKLYYRSLG